MPEYKCTHPNRNLERLCDGNPMGLVAYLDKRMLVGSGDPMAGTLAYINSELGASTGTDIGDFSGDIFMIPRVDVACTRYVIKTAYPMENRGDTFKIKNHETGEEEVAKVTDDSNNILLFQKPFEGLNRRDFAHWMRIYQDRFPDFIGNQLSTWDDHLHWGGPVSDDMYRLLGLFQNRERLLAIYKAFRNQYDVLLHQLESGEGIGTHPLDALVATNQKALPVAKKK